MVDAVVSKTTDFIVSVQIRFRAPIKKRGYLSVCKINIKAIIKLHQKKYRYLEKQFLVEGFHLVEQALKVNKLKTIFVLRSHYEQYQNFKNIIIVDEIILNKLSQSKTPQPVIGLCDFLPITTHYADEKLIILLDYIQDPGNLGTIIRSAVSFGVKTIYLSDNCVDIYNHKVIQASQGAIFNVKFVYTKLKTIIKKLKLEKFKIYGTFLNEQAQDLKLINFAQKKAIIFGNEAKGINQELLKIIDENFIIKINQDINSLNVAIALSIVLFYLQE